MTFAGLMTKVVANVNISFEWIAVLIFFMGALIFFAKDFKLGMIILMITNGGLFIWFYQINYNWTIPLTIFFLSIVVLALSLYSVNKSSATGGFT